jgi:hypothetical protein
VRDILTGRDPRRPRRRANRGHGVEPLRARHPPGPRGDGTSPHSGGSL